MINNLGVAVGLAETTVKDVDCPVSQFKPVFWSNGKVHQLPTFPGDVYGLAAWINDQGQMVGSSGSCAAVFDPNNQVYMMEEHALLWDNGRVINLGNLGGTGANAGNHSCAINNIGQVVGHSELPNDTSFHAFLWTKEKHMQDLGTLDGDSASVSLNINDGGQIVGVSLDSDFNPRAYVWENGVMTDLNTLVPSDSTLYLLLASSINERGDVAGLSVASDGELHGFLAVARRSERDSDEMKTGQHGQKPRPILSDNTHRLVRQLLRTRYHVTGMR